MLNLQIFPQKLMNENELTQYANQKNQEISKLWELKQYNKAVAILDSLYNIPWISKIENTWGKLLYSLACGYSVLGEKQKAINFLYQSAEVGFAKYNIVSKDTDLDNIRTEKRFEEIMMNLKRQKFFWDSNVFNTKYNENINNDEKIAGLSKVWSEAKYNFANLAVKRALSI